MPGIIKGIAFTVDRAAIKKMENEVAWRRGDLHEIRVTDEGTVSIDGAIVFITEEAKSSRELEIKKMQEAVDRLVSENPVR